MLRTHLIAAFGTRILHTYLKGGSMTATLTRRTLTAPHPAMFIAARRALELTEAPLGSEEFWRCYAEIRNHQLACNITPADMIAHPEDYEPDDVERARRFLAAA